MSARISSAAEGEEAVSESGAEVLQGRFIAFFDILGFSVRLQTMGLEELRRLYAGLIDDVQRKVFSPVDMAGVQRSNFARARFLFDSIVLVSHSMDEPATHLQAFNFVAACLTLMETSYALKMPLRGCVGFGDYLDDPVHGIALSRVFPDLVRAEKRQEWTGCFVLPDAAPRLVNALYRASEQEVAARASQQSLLVRHPVPVKDAPSEEQWCLNWCDFVDHPVLDETLEWLISPKRERTREFLEAVRRLPDSARYLPVENQPVHSVRMQVGAGGMRFRFSDERGCAVDPPHGFQLTVVAEARDPTQVG